MAPTATRCVLMCARFPVELVRDLTNRGDEAMSLLRWVGAQGHHRVAHEQRRLDSAGAHEPALWLVPETLAKPVSCPTTGCDRTKRERRSDGEGGWDRSGHDELGRGSGDGGRTGGGHPQRGGRANDAIGGGLHRRDGQRLVGQVAKRQAILNPEATIYSAKRFIGRKWDEVTEEAKIVSYKVVKGPNDAVRFELRGKQYAPEEISALVLRKLADDAAKFLGERVTEAVITVPAYFNDAQRQATKDAGQIAGLEVLRIINKPTAAALAYGLDKKGQETVLVFDLGGGTFDVSILDVGDGVVEVRSTSGDGHLGGDDFDKRIVDWLADEFKKDQGIDLRNDPQALQRLYEGAERAKVELSSTTQAQVNLPFITADASVPSTSTRR